MGSGLRIAGTVTGREQTCLSLQQTSYTSSPKDADYDTSSTTDEDEENVRETMSPDRVVLPNVPALSSDMGSPGLNPAAITSPGRPPPAQNGLACLGSFEGSVAHTSPRKSISKIASMQGSACAWRGSSCRQLKERSAWDIPEAQVRVSTTVSQWVCERYKNFTSRPPSLLQRDLNSYWDKTASLSSALFTSMPLTVAMSKTLWQLLLAFTGLAILCTFAWRCVQVARNGTMEVVQGRIYGEGLSRSGVQRLAFGYSGFGLLSTQWDNVTEVTEHEREISVTFPYTLNINEVWIAATGNGPTAYRIEIRKSRTDLDPREEAYLRANSDSGDGGPAWETWLCCGEGAFGCLERADPYLLPENAAGCVLSHQFQENFFNRRFTVQRRDGMTWYGISFSSGSNWNHHLKDMGPLLAGAGFFLAPPIFGEIGWHRTTKWSGAFFTLLLSIFVLLTLCIGFYDDYQVWLFLAISLMTTFCIIFKQRYIFRVFFGSYGIYFVVVGLDLFSRESNEGIAFLLVGIACAGALMLGEAVKYRTMKKAMALIAEDVKTYDSLWRDICKNAEVVDVLNSLVVLCSCKGGWEKDVRQRDLHGRPLTDLGQIFAQAWAVDPELGRKVVEWAREAGAKKPIQHAKVKSADRAIQKVHRSYAGDPSRLLDISRRTIILKSIEAIMTCITIIRKDPEVKVLRIKNRLAPGSYVDTGYRDLNISLQVQSDDAKALGAELHVCEVQLILMDFYELKTIKGHKAYVEFRNLTGT